MIVRFIIIFSFSVSILYTISVRIDWLKNDLLQWKTSLIVLNFHICTYIECSATCNIHHTNDNINGTNNISISSSSCHPMFLLNDQFQTKLCALFDCNDEWIECWALPKCQITNCNKTHSNNKRTICHKVKE